jgi:hypothetical protein
MALLTNRSLRQKLTLVALVTVIAAQVCAAIVLIGVERGRARRSVITGLEALSRIVVDNTASSAPASTTTIGGSSPHSRCRDPVTPLLCLTAPASALASPTAHRWYRPSAVASAR